MQQDDTILITKIKQSDRNAFKTLFTRYQADLFKYIYYKTLDYSLSEDFVQETFIKVWMKRISLNPDQSVFSYLAAISSNLIRDHFKHLKVREKHQESEKEISTPFHDNPEEVMDYRILREKIHSIVNKHLSDTCRTIFYLSRIEGRSNPEIAGLLKITKKKVENQLYIALKTIRKKLKNPLP